MLKENVIKLKNFLMDNGIELIFNYNKPYEYYANKYDLITDGYIVNIDNMKRLSNHSVVCNVLENVLYVTTEDADNILKVTQDIFNRYNLKIR